MESSEHEHLIYKTTQNKIQEVVQLESKLQDDNKIEVNPYGISGLGGWLILVQIGLYGTLFLAVLQLFLYSIPSFEAETWNIFTSADSEYYHVLWGPVLTFELVYNIVLIVYSVYVLINLYTKKRIFPKLMIIFYAGSLVFGLVDYILLLQIPLVQEVEDSSTIRDLVRSALTCLIWIPYFIKSERVRNTFLK